MKNVCDFFLILIGMIIAWFLVWVFLIMDTSYGAGQPCRLDAECPIGEYCIHPYPTEKGVCMPRK